MTYPILRVAVAVLAFCASLVHADIAPDPQVWIPYGPTRTTPVPSAVHKAVSLPQPRDAALALLLSVTLALGGVTLQRSRNRLRS